MFNGVVAETGPAFQNLRFIHCMTCHGLSKDAFLLLMFVQAQLLQTIKLKFCGKIKDEECEALEAYAHSNNLAVDIKIN